MENLNHRNVIRMHELIDDPDDNNLYFVIDYANLGQVLNLDDQTQKFYLPEKIKIGEEELRCIMRDCVNGLEYSNH
jgi:calcium/calmodulin-dependent protein kinase kinase 2